MAELRSFSTRARITPTSFVNGYEWGAFKGNENAWMEEYFANWGDTHPRAASPLSSARSQDGEALLRRQLRTFIRRTTARGFAVTYCKD